LQSDLNNASDQLRIDQTNNTTGDFPTTVAGLKLSPGNTYPIYQYNNSSTPKTFCLTATNVSRSKSYNINQEGVSSAGVYPIFSIDAGTATSYPGNGTVMTDLSGKGNNATLVNGTSYNTSNGGIMSFDGVNNRIETVSTQTYGNNMTWEAWVNCAQSVNSINMFMGRFLPYFGMYAGNSMFFSNSINGTQRSIRSPTDLLLNNWYHVVFTTKYDGVNTTMSIYVNGVFKVSGTYPGFQSNSSTKFAIGDRRPSTLWYPFKGMVSEIKAYDQTLSTDEINQNFNYTRGRYGI